MAKRDPKNSSNYVTKRKQETTTKVCQVREVLDAPSVDGGSNIPDSEENKGTIRPICLK